MSGAPSKEEKVVMAGDYLEKTIADVETEIESLQSLIRGITRLIRERDSRLPKTTARVEPSTIEFTASDPFVIISDAVKPPEPPPAEPGEASNPKPRAKRGRPAKRSNTLSMIPTGKLAYAINNPKRKLENTKPEDLPEVKRICKDCGEAFPLDEFLRGVNVRYSPPRERCRTCHDEYFTPEGEG